MILTPDFCFIHVPRTGGTSLAKALCTMFKGTPGIPLWHSQREFHNTVRQAMGKAGDSWEKLFSFAFVRNPWERMVSLYASWPQDSDNYRTFEEYLYLFERLPEHQPQTEFTHIAGKQAVTFVGRWENLQEDYRKICSALGRNTPLPHENESSHGNYKDYYTQDLKRYVTEKYTSDIETFGYSF